MAELSFPMAVRANAGIGLVIAHEDADLVVIDKPAGLVVQPGKGHSFDTLLNGLFAVHGKLLQNLGVRRDFGLLHRLDKDTSGLLVVAKMPSAYDQLRRDFEERKVDKEYWAVVLGTPTPKQGVVQARLKEIVEPGAFGKGMKKVMISRQGQEAISAYQVAASAAVAGGTVSLVRVKIKTGRLHQIRAHMLFLGTPVLGDAMYGLAGEGSEKARGGKGKGVPHPPRLCLHAAHLGFKHPTTGKWLHVESELPADLRNYARKLGLGAGTMAK